MTHAVTRSQIDNTFTVEMHYDHYVFYQEGVPVLTHEVPATIRAELEPAAKKWVEAIVTLSEQ